MNNLNHRHLAAFVAHALDGMEFGTAAALAPPKAPRPPVSLFHRCGCGRKISGTRTVCMACKQQHLRDLAGEIHNADDLARATNLMPTDQRLEILEDLYPYLKLEDDATL